MESRLGAEATVLISRDVTKTRKPKGYRLDQIDSLLRKGRTRSEARILQKLGAAGFLVPRVLKVDERNSSILMERIDGALVRDCLSMKNHRAICTELGKCVAKLHGMGIVHGDLTTSNFIWNQGKLWTIDFGLSYHSTKIEDFAVDLHLCRQAFESKHSDIWEHCLPLILASYKETAKAGEEVIKRLELVEARGRNKKKMA